MSPYPTQPLPMGRRNNEGETDAEEYAEHLSDMPGPIGYGVDIDPRNTASPPHTVDIVAFFGNGATWKPNGDAVFGEYYEHCDGG